VEALCELPTADSESPLSPFDPSAPPSWVSGDSPELKYRGWTLKRDKIWFQRSVHTLLRYGYTGWQWAVSSGTFLLSSVPALECLVDKVDEKTQFKHTHNHWITTKYSDGDDYIGNHSDKVEDWAPGSAFVVIKLGDPRPFVFTQSVDGVEVEIYNEVLLAGTAVIVGYNANLKVKHGVPAVGSCGASGSVVGRCITTEFEWSVVQKKVELSAKTKTRAAEKKAAKKATA